MLKRIADTVLATILMLGVAILSPLIFAAYTEAKRNEDWVDSTLDKQ